MSEVSFTRKRGAQFKLSAERKSQLRSLSDEEALRNAAADADNPPIGAERLAKMAAAREVRRIREKTGLSQAEFAAQFRISIGRLRDFEQARSQPDMAMLAFLKIIEAHRELAEQTLRTIEAEGLTPEYA